MENNFKIGDVVIHRKQNHTMTVHEVMPDGKIFCKWFKGDTLREGVFTEKDLIFVR